MGNLESLTRSMILRPMRITGVLFPNKLSKCTNFAILNIYFILVINNLACVLMFDLCAAIGTFLRVTRRGARSACLTACLEL